MKDIIKIIKLHDIGSMKQKWCLLWSENDSIYQTVGVGRSDLEKYVFSQFDLSDKAKEIIACHALDGRSYEDTIKTPEYNYKDIE
jgi:hypothetical protein